MADDGINYATSRPTVLEGKTFVVHENEFEVEKNHQYSYSSIFRPKPAPIFGSALSTTALNNLESQPSFIPQFPNLRKRCLENTEMKLRAIEQNLHNVHDQEEVSKKLDEATVLLKILDDQTKCELKRHQLEDPAYAEERGLEVVHFVIDKNSTSQYSGTQELWMMISQPWGKKSKSLIESDESKVPWIYKFQMQKFAGELNALSKFYFKRKKSTVERQPGSVTIDQETGMFVAVPKMVWLWRIMFFLAFFFLTMFFGVGIIATNSQFSPLFQRIFFWIAIVWTLVPSLLLAWIVRATGGTGKDITSAFIASIAIWLVVIQIGQTHLLTQATNSP